MEKPVAFHEYLRVFWQNSSPINKTIHPPRRSSFSSDTNNELFLAIHVQSDFFFTTPDHHSFYNRKDIEP